MFKDELINNHYIPSCLVIAVCIAAHLDLFHIYNTIMASKSF